jgi:hypothetical protein
MENPKLQNQPISLEKKNLPEVIPKVIQPSKKTEYSTYEEFIKNCPYEALKKANEDVTIVGQGGFEIHDGKPLLSESFVECSGVIFESERALGMVHIDPNEFWQKKIPKIKKYFEGEPTKIILAKGDRAWRPDDINYWVKQMNIPLTESFILEIPSKQSRWKMVYDPTNSHVYVHTSSGDVHAVLEYNIGESTYSLQAHNESKNFFESRDYMPKGFRDMEKHFTDLGYLINDRQFDSWGRNPEKPAGKELTMVEGSRVFIWTPKSGLVEKQVEKDKPLGDILLPEWDPFNTLIFTTSPNTNVDSLDSFKGWVYGYVPDRQNTAFYYDINNILSREELRQRYNESKQEINL